MAKKHLDRRHTFTLTLTGREILHLEQLAENAGVEPNKQAGLLMAGAIAAEMAKRGLTPAHDFTSTTAPEATPETTTTPAAAPAEVI